MTNKTPKEIYELAVSYVQGDDFIIVSSTIKSWAKRILSLNEKYPNEVIIKTINPDGSVVAQMPMKYLKLARPKKRNLTEEQRNEIRERFNNSLGRNN